MKKTILFFIVFAVVLSFTGTVAGIANSMENVRQMVYAGQFYPKNPKNLTRLIKNLTQKALKTEIYIPENHELKALVMPHAGYIYSGLTACHVSFLLKPDVFKKVIVMGPDHRVGFTGNAVSDAQTWTTPLGRINIDEDALNLKRNSKWFKSVPISDSTEHSIEVILPILQTFLEDFTLVPVVAGASDIKTTARKIMDIVDTETLIVASSDLSHFLEYDKAVLHDRKTIDMILNFENDKLEKRENAACGKKPLLVLMQIAEKMHWKPLLLHYSNSGDTGGAKNRVVGYTAIAFFAQTGNVNEQNTNQGDNILQKQFSEKHGDILIKLARNTIADRLGISIDQEKKKLLAQELEDKIFNKKRGTFVTLHINGRLRGCIGNLEPGKTLLKGVKDNALNAAFHDPRFSRLTKKEFKKIDIEVSILSKPEKLEYSDADDLTAKLEPGVHGVIIKKGWASATFLPQVWEQLPDAEQFLSHLCSKAGLSNNEWQKADLEIMTYHVQYFEEKK